MSVERENKSQRSEKKCEMDTKPTYADQSALYGTTEAPPALPGGRVDGTRSFFIVDKSRMMQETDTLEKAKVVYLPESEFRKVSRSPCIPSPSCCRHARRGGVT